jgi:gliding motility-associated-like protein
LNRAINFTILSSNNILNINWDFGDPSTGTLNFSNAANTNHIFSDSGKFTVTAIIEFDCGFDTLTRELQISDCDTLLPECSIYIPNAFTPNKDNFSEFFYPTANCDFEKFEMKIYNRWGEEIFSSSALDAKWNAIYNDKDCTEGVYLYIINYKFYNSELITKKGAVTILR